MNSIEPWVNCCAMRVVRTPAPMMLLLTTPLDAAEYTSPNSAREDLKPVVLALAMLFAVTLRSEVAALRPDRAIEKDMRNS